jgi:predicted dehydrogenase
MTFRLAIIGCGAISEHGHLPGAAFSKSVQATFLVDKSERRLTELSKAFGVSEVSTNLASLCGKVDGAVVATPPGTHAEICCQLAELRIPVLVEKPVALTVAECERMATTAESNGVLLAAGMTRRLFRSDRLVRQVLHSGIFGSLLSFEVENGYDYAWQSASNFILSKTQAGGGVLMGLGSHALDSLLWLIGKPVTTEYHSDAEGGIESECRLDFQMENGATGVMELSRSRNLSNRYRFVLEKGTIEAPFYGDEVSISLSGSPLSLKGLALPIQATAYEPVSTAELMANELEDFANAVVEGTPPMAPFREVMESIALIEYCYSNPKRFGFPWMQHVKS